MKVWTYSWSSRWDYCRHHITTNNCLAITGRSYLPTSIVQENNFPFHTYQVLQRPLHSINLRPLKDFICISPTPTTQSSQPTTAMHRMLYLHNCALLFNGNSDTCSWIGISCLQSSRGCVIAQRATRNPVAQLAQTTLNLLLRWSSRAFTMSQHMWVCWMWSGSLG